MQEHHPPQRKVYECDFCHLTLSSKRSLRLHRKRRHRKEVRELGAGESWDSDSEEDKPKITKRGKPKFKRSFRCKFCMVSWSFSGFSVVGSLRDSNRSIGAATVAVDRAAVNFKKRALV